MTVRADRPTPFDLRYSLDGEARFTDPDGFPAITPPWGTLTAIDMNKASIAWQVPLGEMPGSGVPNSGSENYGGPVVTAGGVVFIGATVYDRKFRAFDAKTGKVLVGDDAARGGQRDARGVRRERQGVRRHRRRRRQVGRGVRRQLRGVRATVAPGSYFVHFVSSRCTKYARYAGDDGSMQPERFSSRTFLNSTGWLSACSAM